MILENLRDVLGRMEAAAARVGRDPSEVELLAVTKQASVDAIEQGLRSGLMRHLGANRVQDAVSKKRQLEQRGVSAVWRMIGHLQSNKAKPALECFDSVDSLDSIRLAERLDSALAGSGRRLPVLVQVKWTQRQSQSGVAPDDVGEFLSRCRRLARLDVRGLMAIAPMLDPVELVRPYFRKMKELFDRLFPPGATAERVLSMGMSRDFEIAVEEGATRVRIGAALFGARLGPKA